jgi:magnesium-transporting ATPase (P-type)
MRYLSLFYWHRDAITRMFVPQSVWRMLFLICSAIFAFVLYVITGAIRHLKLTSERVLQEHGVFSLEMAEHLQMYVCQSVLMILVGLVGRRFLKSLWALSFGLLIKAGIWGLRPLTRALRCVLLFALECLPRV